jgi:hypothetical protein
MSLDHFREIAEEKTRNVVMTQALHARIMVAMKKTVRRTHPRGAMVVAAACLVVMAVSAGVLALGTQGQWFGGEDLTAHGDLLAAQPVASALPNASLLTSEKLIRLSPTALKGNIFPLQHEETGLWGYADEQGNWVVEPTYAKADPIEGMCGRVVTEDGEELLLMMTEVQ